MFEPDEPVYLVAGGPSLLHFDWDCLDHKPCIAINHAHRMLPNAWVLWWTDWRYGDRYGKSLQAHSAPLKACLEDPLERPQPAWAQVYRNTGTEGLSLIPGSLRHGNNSGYAAINLAVQLGARQLVLLGYDFTVHPGRTHWHEPHPWGAMRQEVLTEKMLPHFGPLAVELKALGISVLNANPHSALRVFPFTQEVTTYDHREGRRDPDRLSQPARDPSGPGGDRGPGVQPQPEG
jgi:hypothetical protein